ncbi:MAG: phospholipase domain-containing protein, partial [Ginsengibacter sp.]
EIAEVKNNPFSSLLSQQESGIRNSCALPYQLNAEGELSDDKKTFEIIFSAENDLPGVQSDGSPFNVYAPGKYASIKDNSKIYEEVKSWSYAVRTGDKLKSLWSLENFENDSYHLRVYGPNGFFREYIGNKIDPTVNVKFEYERLKNSPKVFTGNIILHFNNLSDENQSIEVIDNSYKKPKQSLELNKTDSKELVLDLQKSFNWYDISVKIKGNNLFEKRFAGRVETGEPGKSDPFMGRV